MKKACYFWILLFIVFSGNMFSQTLRLSGSVTEGKQPAAFFEVRLIAKDTLYTETDEKGNFKFLIPADRYELKIVYFDEVIKELPVLVEKDTDLGALEIETNTKLGELIIETSKKLMERKADRFVYHVENSTAAAGGTALDALKTTPGIKVGNETISISGKNSVLILIDDKPTYMNQEELMHYLENLSSGNLSKIEVITTPPAKYQAEGNSGIINIVTKQTKKDSWNAALGGAYQRSRRNTQQYNASFNLQKNKLTLRSSVNLGLRRSLINWNNDIYYHDSFWQNENYSDAQNKSINGQAALDYQLTKNWKIGSKISLYKMYFSDAEPQITTVFDKKGGNVQQFLKNNAGSTDKTAQQIYNLYSEYVIDSVGKKLTVDLDFVNYHAPTQRNFSYSTYNPQNELIPGSTHTGSNDVDIKIQNFSAKADVELPTNFADINTGVRFSDSRSQNLILALKEDENGNMVYDANLSNYFEYTEQNEAVYVSGAKKIGDKWNFQLGLRMEATQTKGFSREKGTSHKNDYLKLFPTIYVLHNFSEEKSIGFNYSRRISRPNYESLNPFRTINNEFSYNEGNPFLRPSFSHNFEFTFTYKQSDSRIYFSSSKDVVNQASILNPETKQNNYIWMNYVDEEAIGFTESYTVKPKNWWTSMATFNLNYSLSEIAISDKRYKGLSTSFFLTNDLTLNSEKTLFLSLSYFQNFGETFQNSKLRPYAKFYATVKYLMLDKKLELSISGSDIFNGREYSSQEIHGVTQEFKNIWDSQRLRFALTYRFGNKNMKTAERQSGNTDEINRM